jgi:hypothetical protein
MRCKVLTALYAAVGVQHFILPQEFTFSSIPQVAWMITEAVVVVGASILASDATKFLVEKVRVVLFDQPAPRTNEKRTSSGAETPSPRDPPENPPGSKGFTQTLAAVAEGKN